MRSWGIPITEIADMAAHLPPDSACALALAKHPDPVSASLLREAEHTLRVLTWQLGGGRGTYPERLELPWDPPELGDGDAVDWDDATDVWADPRFEAALAHIEHQMQR